MLAPITVQVLLAIPLVTIFLDYFGINFFKHLKAKEKISFPVQSRQIKYEHRLGVKIGIVFWDLSMVFVMLNIFLFPFINKFVPTWDLSIYTSGIQIFGFCFSFSGCVLLFLAYRALGMNWQDGLRNESAGNGARLIRSGPYKLIRHPVYFAACLISTGYIFVLFNWIILILSLVGGIGYYTLAKDEESGLVDQFGDAYRDYIKNTGRFFPKIKNRISETSSRDRNC